MNIPASEATLARANIHLQPLQDKRQNWGLIHSSESSGYLEIQSYTLSQLERSHRLVLWVAIGDKTGKMAVTPSVVNPFSRLHSWPLGF